MNVQLDSQRFKKNLEVFYFPWTTVTQFLKNLHSGKVKTRRNYKKQQINGSLTGQNRFIHRNNIVDTNGTLFFVTLSFFFNFLRVLKVC
jgi:hypothetical protein